MMPMWVIATVRLTFCCVRHLSPHSTTDSAEGATESGVEGYNIGSHFQRARKGELQ